MTDPKTLIKATQQELDDAKAKGRMIGWIQGAGAVLAVGLAVKLLGWIPLLLVGGAVIYVGYRMVSGRKK